MAVQFDIVAASLTTGWTAGTARTVIEGSAGANHPPEWCDFHVSCMAATGYTIVDLCTYTATGTGSAYTAKRHGQAVGNAESTWKVNMTAEGAGGAVLYGRMYANPFSLDISYPLGRELFHAVSTVMGLRVTPSVVPDATHPLLASLMIEE
jgi:hypothetical protein